MTIEQGKIINRLMRLARKAIRRHGHCCGYGNDRTKRSYCDVCSPLAQAIRDMRKTTKGR
jgi:hypothetical protein